MNWWRSLVAVAVGGLLGCLLRWVLAMLLNRYVPTVPPGTLAANLIGCYIIGVALALFTQYPAFAPEWRLFVTTGFCGGLTTFSTMQVETLKMIEHHYYGLAAGYTCASIIFGLLAVYLATAVVRRVRVR